MALLTPTPTSNVFSWPAQGEWTYADYARLPDNGMRYEVIKRELFNSPAPTTKHQLVSLNLAAALHQFVKKHKLGVVFEAPTDVLLLDLASPVQPDILFIPQEKRSMIKANFIEGVPALIVEILSPSNPEHDQQRKFLLYAQAGVAEYWIVDPTSCAVDIFVLRGNAYVPLGHFGLSDTAVSELLPQFQIKVADFCTP